MMVKNIFRILFIFNLLACTKTIQLDLNNIQPEYVIEGWVDNHGQNIVKISKSVGFYDSLRKVQYIDSAKVFVQDNSGIKFWFKEEKPGLYLNHTLVGNPLQTYTLSVTINNQTFTATSTMPQIVKLDSLIQSKNVIDDNKSNIITPIFTDPISPSNNYQFLLSVNSNKNPYTIPRIYVWDDRVANGTINNRPVQRSRENLIVRGDYVEVEMRCIDRKVYYYFVAIQQNNSNQITPANPSSNFTGEVLGYFSAYTSDTKTLIIK